MSEIVDRVAKAICRDRFLGEWDESVWDACGDQMQDDYRGNARAAIEAMRQPTEAMKSAITVAAWRSGPGVDPSTVCAAMISAALKESP